ncbi:uncharacterized protein BT62DRAFT_906245 [Guyanagaster necrorhizus]|uniref:Uncharacterized protein n=1 Tax=Guyanagaster necrorhizus TaxID=856835 RepID=A0A9P7VJI3_9AGAR|nr:uncharacterized protein BT62DRAFT_906245 [Guyanagaster necrorhizus MCA 3950]KAG7442291.1 hypothetical protein BT62DRAFT_906245 [Guyanagaster necrorhizus MCA 3950]
MIDIFFLELVAILSTIQYAVCLLKLPQHLLLFTDSLNSVTAFNFLSVSELLHNVLLLRAADLILRSGINIYVQHIDRKENIWVDMLSCLLDEYHHKFTADHVCIFTSLRDLLPA